jgi:hypothetical protein
VASSLNQVDFGARPRSEKLGKLLLDAWRRLAPRQTIVFNQTSPAVGDGGPHSLFR